MEKKHKRKRLELHEISLENDISYRGPLSYRHFKIIGWLLMGVAQIHVLSSLASKVAPDMQLFSPVTLAVLTMVANMSIPLFLLANFSRILDHSNGYKTQMLINGLAAATIALVYLFIVLRYGAGLVTAMVGDSAKAMQMIDNLFAESSNGRFLSFNFFIDFFLCTLFMFFLNYRPKHFFTGKKLFFFRMFSIIPVLYEITSLILKYLASRKGLILPAVLFPFLTTKPLIMFLVFVVLALFIKNRERLFCKNGRTHQEYKAFLKTNRNSLHFSVFTSVIFLVAGIMDIILVLIIVWIYKGDTVIAQDVSRSLGLGRSALLILLVPFILLFSYTRRYRGMLADIFIPVGGIVFIVFIYMEAIYQALKAFFLNH